MYGFVNQMVQDYVETQHGPETWRRVARAAQLESGPFLTMEAYPDKVTGDMVAAICAETGLAPETVLNAVGQYYVGYASSHGYDALMRAAGGAFPTFLNNLDRLHRQLGAVFPDLKPPSFRVSEVTDTSLHLHYYSTRDGLAPMVIGSLHSLGGRFGLTLEVVHVAHRATAGHDEFAVTFTQELP